jgi:acetyl esterase/lipase
MIQPQPSSYEAFPESRISASGMQTIPADFRDRSCTMHLGVEYAQKSGVPLHLHIIEPRLREGEQTRFPLVIYIQGSAWLQQNTALNLAQLARFAQRGFVVAVVQYRPSVLAPFPAQIQDTKTALHWMTTNAAAYNVDPGAIILWGDSSGGHTAVMTGVTLDGAGLDEQPPAIHQRAVRAVVDYYGPTEISKMNDEPSTMDHCGPDSPEGLLIGGLPVLESPEKVRPTIPMNYISEERAIPPILIFHGNKDRLVPFGQSVMLFEALRRANKVAEFYQLSGADHGGPPFWTGEVLDIVEGFVRRYL